MITVSWFTPNLNGRKVFKTDSSSIAFIKKVKDVFDTVNASEGFYLKVISFKNIEYSSIKELKQQCDFIASEEDDIIHFHQQKSKLQVKFSSTPVFTEGKDALVYESGTGYFIINEQGTQSLYKQKS